MPVLKDVPSNYSENEENEKLIYFYRIKRDGYYLIKIGICRIVENLTTEENIWDRIDKTPRIHRFPKRTRATTKILGALFGNRSLEDSIHKLFRHNKFRNMENYATGKFLNEYYHNNGNTMEQLVNILENQTELLSINNNKMYFNKYLCSKLLNQSHF